jgi:recombination protein RecA
MGYLNVAEKKKPIQMASPASDKKKALETALAQIEKSYGKGSIMRLGETLAINVEVISTGSLAINIALGIGGVPKGRIIEIYGPESSGKTTLALHIVASAQKLGGEVAFIDVEHAMEPAYARALGVDIDNLLIAQPGTGEDALAITDTLVRSGGLDVVVIDSVAALVPRVEVEGEIGESTVGVIARLMSQALRKLAGSISRTNCIVIFINQLREKIGVMYGNPETTPGGRALKYFASVRIDVRKGEPIKNGSEVIGNRTKAKIVKNKVAPPFKTAEFDMMYGEGISRTGEIADFGVELGFIDKSGAWFTVNETRLQGRDAVKEYLKNNPEFADELEKKIYENADKLLPTKSKADKKAAAAAAKAAGQAVDVAADDFEDAETGTATDADADYDA